MKNLFDTATLPADEFQKKNAKAFKDFNNGMRFCIVFSSPLQFDGKICVAANYHEGDLFYALVVLKNGQVLPYPVFEDGMGHHFMKTECQALEHAEEQCEVLATQEVFCDWLVSIFGDQFAGLVESWSGDRDDRRSAIAFAARVARGPEEVLKKYSTGSEMRAGILHLQYEIAVLKKNGYPDNVALGVVGIMQSIIDNLVKSSWLAGVKLIVILGDDFTALDKTRFFPVSYGHLVKYPESKLSLGYQVLKADEIIWKLGRKKAPLVIATHSEVMFLRFRVRAAQTFYGLAPEGLELHPTEVQFLWFSGDEFQKVEFSEDMLSLEDCPQGLIDQVSVATKEVITISKITIDKMNGKL